MNAVAPAPVEDLVRHDGEEVHRRVYTDPSIFEEEMRRIFGSTWVFAGHESEVPNPGDFKTTEIAGQPVLLSRHSDGRVHVMFNTCRHRGAKVCLERSGNARNFRCLYHGWVYDTCGQLIGLPFREGFGDDFDLADHGLVPLPSQATHQGFVFVSLSPDPPDFDEWLGAGKYYLDLMVERAPERRIQATTPLKYDFAGNWKLQMENYADNYHPPILHQAALEVGHEMMKEKYGDEAYRLPTKKGEQVLYERSFGRGHGMVDFVKTRSFLWHPAFDNEGYRQALVDHGRSEEQARELAETDVHLVIYPNLLLHSRLNHYRVVKPDAVDHTTIEVYRCKLVGAPDDLNSALGLLTSQHVSAGGEIQVDDLKAFEAVSAGLKSEGVDWLLLKLHGANEHVTERGEFEAMGASETIPRAQYQEWARLMAQS